MLTSVCVLLCFALAAWAFQSLATTAKYTDSAVKSVESIIAQLKRK